jgi:predicted permease
MTGFLLLASGQFVECLIRDFSRGPFPQTALPLLYLIVFSLPAVITLVQLCASYHHHDRPLVVQDAITPLNIFFGISADMILGFFHLTTPNVDVFFQSSGMVISVLVLLILGVNLQLRYGGPI